MAFWKGWGLCTTMFRSGAREGFVALDGIERRAGVGVGPVEAAEDVAALALAGCLDGLFETFVANAPLFIGGAGDAEEVAGLLNGLAVGEVEEIVLAAFAGPELGGAFPGCLRGLLDVGLGSTGVSRGLALSMAIRCCRVVGALGWNWCGLWGLALAWPGYVLDGFAKNFIAPRSMLGFLYLADSA